MQIYKSDGNLPQRRPTESGTTVAAAAVAVLTFYKVIPTEITWAAVLLVGAVPSGITWLVTKIKGD